MSRRGQRGVALVTAVVLVALATIMAVAIGSRSALSARRSVANLGYEQALQLAAGAEALAAYVLHEDRNNQDTLAESWNQPYGPAEVAPGITLEAQLSDEQGKFNLNTLVDARGEADPDAVAVFARLLELLQLEPNWAPLLVDWLDSNNLPESEGGEDALYLGQVPPYRPANTTITSVSELLQLPGFGRERYLRLAPHVTALPPQATRINACTASPFVLDALAALSLTNKNAVEYSTMDPKQLAEMRSSGCFPTLAALKSTLRPDIDRRVGERSSYFRLQSWISIGTAQFALYSLMQRDDSGQVRPVLRTLGTE
jgi:general secretion pathway protein K